MSTPIPPPWLAPLAAAIRTHSLHAAARYAQLATVRPDGRPANRTVVVRELLGSDGRLVAITDARSPKAGQLAAMPWAELCWYFPDTREQFRLLGQVTSVGPDDATELAAVRKRHWGWLPEPSKRSFTWPKPGLPRAAAAAFEGKAPAEPPPFFVLLVLDPVQVDHLDLREQPHARMRYVRDAGLWSIEPINP
jgi:pyridoxamine 5'-phosphate oxidase